MTGVVDACFEFRRDSCFRARNTAMMQCSHPSHRASRYESHGQQAETRTARGQARKSSCPPSWSCLSSHVSGSRKLSQRAKNTDIQISSFLRTHVDVEHHVALIKLLRVVDPRGHDGSHGGGSCSARCTARRLTGRDSRGSTAWSNETYPQKVSVPVLRVPNKRYGVFFISFFGFGFDPATRLTTDRERSC